jgi:hypothetical protein
MELEAWKAKIKPRAYAHFDRKISLSQAWSYITNTGKIKKHGFYPFIHYTMTIRKYSKAKGRHSKPRDICYAAHLDRYIYQYYAYLLNEKYNERLSQDGLNDCVIAYRNNLEKNNNIHFAKRAFDQIRSQEHSYVIIGDFTNFFDTLDHAYLKNRICDLLGTKRLYDDWYAVYKNITGYSQWELSDLLSVNRLQNSHADIKSFNKRDRALTLEQFKSLKSKYISSNKKSVGIPQGSPISAIFSNVYMMEFDAKLNAYVALKQGLYMRYSDDFIIVIPASESESLEREFEWIMSAVGSTKSLTLEHDKTHLFEHQAGKIDAYQVSSSDGTLTRLNKKTIDYLGFTYDGSHVSVRDKTVSKYYNKLNRELKRYNKRKHKSQTKKIIRGIRIYRRYAQPKVRLKSNKRNFLSYINNAERVFGTEEKVNILKKRHVLKIRRVIKAKQFGN